MLCLRVAAASYVCAWRRSAQADSRLAPLCLSNPALSRRGFAVAAWAAHRLDLERLTQVVRYTLPLKGSGRGSRGCRFCKGDGAPDMRRSLGTLEKLSSICSCRVVVLGSSLEGPLGFSLEALPQVFHVKVFVSVGKNFVGNSFPEFLGHPSGGRKGCRLNSGTRER